MPDWLAIKLEIGTPTAAIVDNRGNRNTEVLLGFRVGKARIEHFTAAKPQ